MVTTKDADQGLASMTADWSMIVLDADAIAAGALEKIREEVGRFFVLHDRGLTVAVFTRRAKSGACEVYFSPDCRRKERPA